ncbi:MAG: CopY family transcriptional regulator [Planctomycetes bacterium]|nr:CopY family transcriptional regulator [Planctomycetota bacterium]
MTPPRPDDVTLSRREREIMDIIYARGEATAGEILEDLSDPPSYSAVRGLVRVLEEKGHLRHRREGVRNVYLPVRPRRVAGRSALKRTVETFFDGDVRQAVVTLLDVGSTGLSDEDRKRIEKLIGKARKEGR